MTHPPSEAAVPTDEPDFFVRALTESDWPAAKAVDAAAFGYEPDEDYLDNVSLPAQDISRFTGVFDPALDRLLIGIGAIQSRCLTLPGSGPSPVAAVTWVGVRPDQQRRGVLRHLMKAQLHGLHESTAESIAILTASEAAIYGRFGYGPAIRTVRLELPAPTALRPGIRTEPVLELEPAMALPRLKEIHAAVQPAFVGYLDRPEAVWNSLLTEHPFAQKGRGPRRIAVHSEGYIVFRLSESWTDRGPDYTLAISEICAATPIARASLWQHVLCYPLVRRVEFPKAWLDEPLPEMLTDPRSISSDLGDHVWVRLVDLSRAIELRTYSAPADVVVKVSDGFCRWNDNNWRLHLTANGGSATASVEPAEVDLDIADLGAAFLGGTRIARLFEAGRVTGALDAVAVLDAALATPLAPWTPEGF